MVDAYYRETALQDALIAMLNSGVLPEGHSAAGPGTTPAVGVCVVEVLPPAAGFTSLMGGPSFAGADFQTSCVGRDAAHARKFGALVRQAITERDWRGPFINPIVTDHLRVDDVDHRTGFLQQDKGTNTWVGDYRASYQATQPPVIPSS